MSYASNSVLREFSLADVADNISCMADEIVELRDARDDAENRIEELEKENDSLKSELADLEKECARLSDEIENMR